MMSSSLILLPHTSVGRGEMIMLRPDSSVCASTTPTMPLAWRTDSLHQTQVAGTRLGIGCMVSSTGHIELSLFLSFDDCRFFVLEGTFDVWLEYHDGS